MMSLCSVYLLCNLKSSTVKSYISGIRSVLAALGEKLNELNYLLKSLTRACKIRNDEIVHRLPISKGVLKLILDSTQQLFHDQPYLAALYSAIFSTAFYGLLRISEIAKGPHVILANNVHVGRNMDKMLFILQSSKTYNKGDKPQFVKITRKTWAQPHTLTDNYCPFKLLKDFIKLRPHSSTLQEEFFVFTDR